MLFQFNLQALEKNINYRTQLLHSHLTQRGSERSTHLKINYNNLMPLVAGLHWKSPPKDALHKIWEGKNNSQPSYITSCLRSAFSFHIPQLYFLYTKLFFKVCITYFSYHRLGSFNMDTPWLYIYTALKLNQLQSHTLQLTSELTASKWLTIRNLVLEGFYRDKGREKEARLELYTPAITYLQVRRE